MFDDIYSVPKKDEPENFKSVGRDFFPDFKKKKEQASQQSELRGNFGKIKIIDRIIEHSVIAYKTKKTRKT